MSKHLEPYVYRLTLCNRTRQDLVFLKGQINRGVWCTGGVTGQAPLSVPAGATVEAMGIQASTVNPRGYECRCVWGEDPPSSDMRSEVALFVSVPLLGGNNRAGLDVSGRFKVEGWTGVSRIGHEFSHVLTVTYAV